MVKNDFWSASVASVAYSSSSHIRKYTADDSGTHRHRDASETSADLARIASFENGATHFGPPLFTPLCSRHTSIDSVRQRKTGVSSSPLIVAFSGSHRRTLCTTRVRASGSSGCAKQWCAASVALDSVRKKRDPAEKLPSGKMVLSSFAPRKIHKGSSSTNATCSPHSAPPQEEMASSFPIVGMAR